MDEEKDLEPEEEMVKDVLQIMNVFVAKINGRRKYKLKDKKQEFYIYINIKFCKKICKILSAAGCPIIFFIRGSFFCKFRFS